MKHGVGLFIILVCVAGFLFALKSGSLNTEKDEYASLELPEIIDYNFHIKPILSDNCYTCHGPDANKRKARLRLDIEKMAFSELPESPGEFAFVSHNSRKSKAYLVMVSDDPNKMMPPPSSKLSLNNYEKRLIKKWIEQGAKFEKHWAYIPPRKKEVEIESSNAWGNNEIDYFILHKLREHGLNPSEKASDETLLRRISLDLTGLPPNPSLVAEMLKYPQEEKIEMVIDRFLGTLAYSCLHEQAI